MSIQNCHTSPWAWALPIQSANKLCWGPGAGNREAARLPVAVIAVS